MGGLSFSASGASALRSPGSHNAAMNAVNLLLSPGETIRLSATRRPRAELSRTNSSADGVGITERARYWVALFTMKLRGLGRGPDFSAERASLAEYREALARHAGKRLEDCRALEIGFG